MFDLKRTLQIVIGMLIRPEQTWDGYYPESHDWKQTLGLITVPMVIASTLFLYLWTTLFFGSWLGASLGFGGLVAMILSSAVTTGVGVLVITVLAGVFKGNPDFPKGLAAVSLASVPAWVGSLMAPLPFIGLLLTLGLGIYSTVLIYRIIPRYLEVPQNYRIAHFAASLIAGFIAVTVLSPFQPDFFPGAREELSRLSSDEPGLKQEFQQAEDTMETAEDDGYSHSDDGQLYELYRRYEDELQSIRS